jgi:hypothetical protein
MAERCGQQNTADAFSIGAVTRWANDQRLTLSQSEQEVVRRPARLGLSDRCGLTLSIAASASPY